MSSTQTNFLGRNVLRRRGTERLNCSVLARITLAIDEYISARRVIRSRSTGCGVSRAIVNQRNGVRERKDYSRFRTRAEIRVEQICIRHRFASCKAIAIDFDILRSGQIDSRAGGAIEAVTGDLDLLEAWINSRHFIRGIVVIREDI